MAVDHTLVGVIAGSDCSRSLAAAVGLDSHTEIVDCKDQTF